MKKHFHLLVGILFFLVLLFDLSVWGSVPDLPEVGPMIEASARREAPLVTTYIVVGKFVVGAVSPLHGIGTDIADRALSPSYERIRLDPAVAMSVIFDTRSNTTHFLVRTGVWAAPLLLVLYAIAWTRRPRQVRMMGRR
jgi:hypothetical protein